MELQLINQSQVRMPKKMIHLWLEKLAKRLKIPKGSALTVVFLDPQPAQKLNQEFRGRKYATDILSFPGQESELGELAICPQVLQKQAKEHGLSFQLELAYMLTHGVLHLLGYDHEDPSAKGQRQAKKMYQLQDHLFDRIAKAIDL